MWRYMYIKYTTVFIILTFISKSKSTVGNIYMYRSIYNNKLDILIFFKYFIYYINCIKPINSLLLGHGVILILTLTEKNMLNKLLPRANKAIKIKNTINLIFS